MMDCFIVVIEPGARSVQTYEKVKKLAADLGIYQVFVVANKIRDASDEDFVRAHIPAGDLLGLIHYNSDVIDADRKGLSPYDCSPAALDEIRAIKAKMDMRRRADPFPRGRRRAARARLQQPGALVASGGLFPGGGAP